MRCKEIEGQLADLNDGVLDETTAGTIRAHLGVCQECEARAEAVKRGALFMGSLDTVEPPQQLRRQILGATPTPRIRWRWQPALGMALAAGVVAAVWWSSLNRWPAAIPSPTSQTRDVLARLQSAEREYVAAIEQLESQVQQASASWPENLQDTFDTNLAIVDRAILDTQMAVDSYRANPEARSYVLAAYQDKVELLTEATEWRF